MPTREQQIKEIQEADKAVLEVLKEVPKALPALVIKGFTAIVFFSCCTTRLFPCEASPSSQSLQ